MESDDQKERGDVNDHVYWTAGHSCGNGTVGFEGLDPLGACVAIQNDSWRELSIRSLKPKFFQPHSIKSLLLQGLML